MHFIKNIFIYLIAFISCSLLIAIGIPPFFIFLLLFLYLVVFTLLPHLHIIFWTKNIKKVDRFLQNNRSKLFFSYFYAFAHESDDQQRILLQKIVQRKQPPDEEHYFKAMLALLNHDYSNANAEAKQIINHDFRIYTLAYIAIFEGNYDLASHLASELTTTWRKYTIRSLLAFQQNQLQEFYELSSYALEQTRGIERYVISHLLNKK
ncbi:MAG: hypothetical protein KBT36_02830 [Kurthia sp.]|nr:hypothetical protein [Candidatus Kurthia equi]